MSSQDQPTRVAICIVTRQRPEGLARTLASIAKIQIPPHYEAEVIVVDNDDPDAAMDPLEPIFEKPVHRIPEPIPGIPFARNRAIDEAKERAHFLVFIDDDETVEEDWLVELLATQEKYSAPIVTGPALPRLPEDAPSWAIRSGVYDCNRYPTGTERPWAFTHNVLARTSLFSNGRFRFDEQMRFTGGSDTQLFRKLHEAGHKIIWCNEAIAWEWYPASRISFKWILARSYRIGLTDSWMDIRRKGRIRVIPKTLWLAFKYCARGGVRFLRSITHLETAWAACGWDLARAYGLVAGMLGIRYDEYRKIHGN